MSALFQSILASISVIFSKWIDSIYLSKEFLHALYIKSEYSFMNEVFNLKEIQRAIEELHLAVKTYSINQPTNNS
jgi:predicted nucleic acid-binding protein